MGMVVQYPNPNETGKSYQMIAEQTKVSYYLDNIYDTDETQNSTNNLSQYKYVPVQLGSVLNDF
eukprot:scaffold8163_cov149-Cylindrotheca_fusiformis.AAC.2